MGFQPMVSLGLVLDRNLVVVGKGMATILFHPISDLAMGLSMAADAEIGRAQRHTVHPGIVLFLRQNTTLLLYQATRRQGPRVSMTLAL